jgi:hypothetical protein
MLGCCCCCCWKGQILHHIYCWRVQRTWWVHGDYELYVVVAWLPHGRCIDAGASTARDKKPAADCRSLAAHGIADRTP